MKSESSLSDSLSAACKARPERVSVQQIAVPCSQSAHKARNTPEGAPQRTFCGLRHAAAEVSASLQSIER